MAFASRSDPISVALPKSTFPGNRPQEARGVLMNCYAEPIGEEGDVRWRRVPGLTEFSTSTETNFRGFAEVPGSLYVVLGQRVIRYTSTGVATVLTGSVSGDEPVIMARNNAATPDVVIVAPGDGAYWISGDSVVAYPDPDIGQPNAVCVFKSFFIFTYGDGTMLATSPNSTAINTLDNATAEYRPDTLYRPVPAGGVLLLFGSSSIEVWGGSANDPPGFPFSFMQGIDRGLAGRYAISGYQEGFGGGIVFVGDDNGVYQFTSGAPSKISPPDLDLLIGKADKSTLEVTTFASRGHLFAAVQSDDWTWVFDLNTQKWHLRQSYLQPRWRATQAILAFGKWIVGDTLSGSLAVIDGDAHTEFGKPLRYSITTGPQKKFPSRFRINRAHVHATVGTGIVTGLSPIQTDPIIEIEVSGDGGLTWTHPRQLPLGKQAVGRQAIAANNFGHATGQGILIRMAVADPVDASIMGAALEIRELAA